MSVCAQCTWFSQPHVATLIAVKKSVRSQRVYLRVNYGLFTTTYSIFLQPNKMGHDVSTGIIEFIMDHFTEENEGTFTCQITDGGGKAQSSLVLIGDGKWGQVWFLTVRTSTVFLKWSNTYSPARTDYNLPPTEQWSVDNNMFLHSHFFFLHCSCSCSMLSLHVQKGLAIFKSLFSSLLMGNAGMNTAYWHIYSIKYICACLCVWQ